MRCRDDTAVLGVDVGNERQRPSFTGLYTELAPAFRRLRDALAEPEVAA